MPGAKSSPNGEDKKRLIPFTQFINYFYVMTKRVADYANLSAVESVTAGHPDKVCDQISDAVLDACMAQDTNSRVAIEVFGGHGLLVIGGEVTTKAKIDYAAIGRNIYKAIGYQDELEVIVRVAQQSPDIEMGVVTGGAGDQGIMYGYATNATDDYLPFGYGLVNKLTRGLHELRSNNTLPWLLPDGKAQLTVSNHKVINALVSTQHQAEVSQQEIKAALIKHLFVPVLGDIKDIEILVNPTGQFIQGGFEADTGLTGRKIMVDIYGGKYPHGGGAFSGKDPSKVDRSAAYMCRYVAKNLVASGLCDTCFVSVAYAIGKAEPVMVYAEDGNGKAIDRKILNKYDFRPLAIIERLDLRRPIYLNTAAYGHFTKTDLPWEQIDK